MITDASRYYGCVIASLADLAVVTLQVKKLDDGIAGFYLLQDSVPIYIKYSTIRTGPWTFNFHRSHKESERALFLQYGECIVIFVCGKDGIAALRHNEFRVLLDDDFEDQQSVIIRRKRNQMYSVSGRNGSLERKVSRKSLEDIFNTYLNRSLQSSSGFDDAKAIRQPA